jgi:hypothetical protein
VAVVVASEFVFFLSSSLSPSSSLSGRFLIGAFMVALLKGLLFSLLDSEFDACCVVVVVVIIRCVCIATDMMFVFRARFSKMCRDIAPLKAVTRCHVGVGSCETLSTFLKNLLVFASSFFLLEEVSDSKKCER